MSRLPRPRLGLRREILILLPVTLILMVLLAGATLFAYRSAIDLLTEDRQREVGLMARQLAAELSGGPLPRAADVRRRVPQAGRISILDARGRTLSSFGDVDPGAGGLLLQGLAEGAGAIGPGGIAGEMIVGFARFESAAGDHVLRLDMPAFELARQREVARVMTWVVLPTTVALLVLGLLFLPHFLKPYDTLAAQVQRVVPDAPDPDDVTRMVATVERALAALATESTAEDELTTLQRTLGSSLESGLLLLDREGQVLSLNALGATLLQIDTVDRPIALAACLSSHPGLVRVLSTAVAKAQGMSRQEIDIQTSTGSRTLGLTVHALRRDDGSVRGHLALFVDLTESRREAEAKQIATSLEQLGELAAGVAHELRNSLATLRGYLTLIERHPEEESITDYFHEIRRESDHLQRVLEDFLTFAQPESVRVATVDLAEICRRAVSDPALVDHAVDLRIPDSSSWRLQGDAQLLERALRNLLHNAVRAQAEAHSEVPVELRLQRLPESLEVRILDRGPGLPDEVRRRLFQPFVTTHSDGAGLGLSLAHRIVTLHHGRIRLENRAEGGTRVLLSFPLGASG